MDKLKLMNMTKDHIDGVMVVEHLSFRIPWSKNAFIEEVTNNKFAIYIVAQINDVIVGYAGMWKVFDEGHITNVAVHPKYRRNKIGSALVEELIQIAKKEKIQSMTLEVRKSNFAAQNLYIRYGFESGGFRKSYYADNGEDALIMWKKDV